MLNYAVAISKDEGMNNYCAIIPDVEGCYTYGDTIDELLAETKSAIESHIDTTLDLGLPFEFKARNIEELKSNPDYADTMLWAIVSVDEEKFTKQVRFNVSWSEHLLNQVDAYIAKTHDTRSGFLAKAVTYLMNAKIL